MLFGETLNREILATAQHLLRAVERGVAVVALQLRDVYHLTAHTPGRLELVEGAETEPHAEIGVGISIIVPVGGFAALADGDNGLALGVVGALNQNLRRALARLAILLCQQLQDAVFGQGVRHQGQPLGIRTQEQRGIRLALLRGVDAVVAPVHLDDGFVSAAVGITRHLNGPGSLAGLVVVVVLAADDEQQDEQGIEASFHTKSTFSLRTLVNTLPPILVEISLETDFV